MLDINLIRNNPELVKKGIAAKNINPKSVDDFLVLDEKWRNSNKQVDDLRARLNVLSKERKIDEAKKVKAELGKFEDDLKVIENDRLAALKQFPNLPLSEVPVGKDESGNQVIREVGDKTKFDFQPKEHLEIAEKLDLIDVERASKVSGSRFGYIKNQAALLEFAIINLTFEVLGKEGFRAIVPPTMIKPEMMWGMGYIDTESDKAERYILEKDNLVLVGTAEQSVGPMHQGEIFLEKELPLRYAAFSTCFREEAGSYGKDTRGILRVHQFDKIEMFSYCLPEKSKKEHELIIAMEEKLMGLLKIPYRIVQLCSGDLARPSAATYDVESWFPGQDQYRETHSSSNCTDFQARRLNIRYRDKLNKTNFVHTLNGTAFAIGRILIAIIENYQTKDGEIKIPEALVKYTGFKEIKK